MRSGAGRLLGLWLLAVAALGAGLGCATRTTTVTTERTGAEGDSRTTVTRETEEVVHPTGVLSTTVHLVGEVIALPFRVLAGIVEIVF